MELVGAAIVRAPEQVDTQVSARRQVVPPVTIAGNRVSASRVMVRGTIDDRWPAIYELCSWRCSASCASGGRYIGLQTHATENALYSLIQHRHEKKIAAAKKSISCAELP